MKQAKLLPIVELVNILVKRGILNSDEHVALVKAVNDLRHAIDIKDYSLVEKAVSKIAKLLVENGRNQL